MAKEISYAHNLVVQGRGGSIISIMCLIIHLVDGNWFGAFTLISLWIAKRAVPRLIFYRHIDITLYLSLMAGLSSPSEARSSETNLVLKGARALWADCLGIQ